MNVRFRLLLLSLAGLVLLGLVTGRGWGAGSEVPSSGEDARQILETARNKQLDRWEGVDVYRVDQTLMGTTVRSWFVRTEVTDDAGESQTLFLPESSGAAAQQTCSGAKQLDADGLDAYADGLEKTGAALGAEYERGLEQAGLPKGLLSVGDGTPWTSFDPRVSMGGMADFVRAAAGAKREEAGAGAQRQASAMDSTAQTARFMETARLVGRETVDGRPAFHLTSTDVDEVQQIEGGEYRMEAVSLWLDAEEYVPLRMTVEGTMASGDDVRAVTIESLQSDYRRVPNSRMYEPYRRVTSISNEMTPEQEAEMLKARQQMQEFEQQLAAMPPDQRRMTEKMMGPQLEMMRSMAAGDGFHTEVTVSEIAVNPEASGDPEASCGTGGAMQTGRAMQTGTPDAVGSSQAATAQAATAGSPEPSVPSAEGTALEAAREACLKDRMAQAQAAQTSRRGFGRLLSGVSRVASRFGGRGVAEDVGQTTAAVYDANATADDVAAAAKDLGLTADDIDDCRNPT